MPTEIKTIEKRSKWETLFDKCLPGKKWSIKRGVDFANTATISTARIEACKYAKRHNLKPKTHKVSEEVLEVHFTKTSKRQPS